MAKKQTRRSISVSRGTYERLKAYCETNKISMSQFVERRVGDFLGRAGVNAPQPAPSAAAPVASGQVASPVATAQATSATQRDAFEVSAPAAPVKTPPTPSRLSMNQPLSQAVGPANPVVKPDSDEPMLKDPDAKLTADQIFTF